MQSVERNHYCNGNEPITHLTVWVSLCTVECLVCVYANNNYIFGVSEIIFKGHGITESEWNVSEVRKIKLAY